MTRETRLSPRRAWKAQSRLPLSPRRTQVRLKPLLFLRPHPPKGGKPRSETPRFCAHREHPFFDARSRSARLAARIRLCPTAPLQRKSTVCGSKRRRPSLAPLGGPLDLNPRPVSLQARGSCTGAFLRRVNRTTVVSGLERKIAMQTNFSLQLGNRSIPGEQKESTAWPSRSGDGQLELTNN